MTSPKDTFFIRTYGCQMNKNDSEHLKSYLIHQGYTPINDEAQADLVVLNTCSVRDKSERKAVGKFHELNHERLKGRKIKMAIAGCMPGHNKEKVFSGVTFC